MDVAECQISRLKANQEMYVLNTCILYVYEYNPSMLDWLDRKWKSKDSRTLIPWKSRTATCTSMTCSCFLYSLGRYMVTLIIFLWNLVNLCLEFICHFTKNLDKYCWVEQRYLIRDWEPPYCPCTMGLWGIYHLSHWKDVVSWQLRKILLCFRNGNSQWRIVFQHI